MRREPILRDNRDNRARHTSKDNPPTEALFIIMKTPEFKRMMGERFLNDDGFTYVYGAIKHCSETNRSSNRASVKRAIRNDKRSVRQKELKRILKEFE